MVTEISVAGVEGAAFVPFYTKEVVLFVGGCSQGLASVTSLADTAWLPMGDHKGIKVASMTTPRKHLTASLIDNKL